MEAEQIRFGQKVKSVRSERYPDDVGKTLTICEVFAGGRIFKAKYENNVAVLYPDDVDLQAE